MAARDNTFDMQIKLLMIGDSGKKFTNFPALRTVHEHESLN